MDTPHSPAPAPMGTRKKTNIIACLPLPLSVAIACIYPNAAQALPQNPDVASGLVSITTADRAMQINQMTNKAIIDWQKFGIASNESVTFNQPSRSSVVLNRVSGAEFSALDGALNATGQVFIINPNGVLIGSTAHVNVGGLLASTLDIENRRFLNSDYTFSARPGTDSSLVANVGTIAAVDGGYVVLLSNSVRNSGTIDAPSGHVLMAAGGQATLYISDYSLLGYRIDTGSAAALVENLNTVRADGGQVSLAARGLTGASLLASAAVNNSGIIEARTLNGRPGAIVLSGDMQSGRVSVTGKLDASAQMGKGGTIDTSASLVSIGSSADISAAAPSGQTGLWTINSANPVIGQELDSISNTVVSSTLDKSKVTIIANGSSAEKRGTLTVDGEIAAQGTNRLTLKAEKNLLINAPVSVGSGGLLAYAGVDGSGDGKVIVAPNARIHSGDGGAIDLYTNVPDYRNTAGYDGFITSPYRLWMLVNNISQLQDIDLNLSGNYALGRDIDAVDTAKWNDGAGFRPIGLDRSYFSGQLDGMNHVVSNLVINRPRSNVVGLFSGLTGAVRNLGLQDIHVTANSSAGAFVGDNHGTLNNVYASGAVSVEVEAYNEQTPSIAGGLAGVNYGLIKDAYSLVNVHGYWILGGIAGINRGVVDSVYAAGKVGKGTRGDILFRYGGLVGDNSGQVRNAYWTNDGTGKNRAFGSDSAPAGMNNSSTMLTNEGLRNSILGLDFDGAWFRYDGYTAPLLRSFMKPLTVSGISRQIDKIYDGLAFDFQPGFYYSSTEAALSDRLNSSHGAVIDGQLADVGNYKSSATTVFWSDQQGYLISNPVIRQDTTVAISARPITVQASSDTKVFDNSDTSSAMPRVSNNNSKLNLGLANGDALNASQSFDTKEAGDRTLTVSFLEIKDSAGKNVTSNYLVSRADAIGKIFAPKPDPKPDPIPDPGTGHEPDAKPEPKPDYIPYPTPDPGTNLPGDQSGGNGQGGISDPSSNPSSGKNPGDAAGGSTSGSTSLPADSVGEQQRHAARFAYFSFQDEEEAKKKRLRDEKLKNDVSLSIRNGGIHVPGEIFQEE